MTADPGLLEAGGLERILGPEGLLARHIDGFSFRPQQLEMAAAVSAVMDEGGVLVSEAGAGRARLDFTLPVIFLMLFGGPSQLETFDMKPDHENGGEFREIATRVPGLRFSEHLPLLAKHAEHLAIVRDVKKKHTTMHHRSAVHRVYFHV